MSDPGLPELTERQRDILRRVVEEFVATGQPVGSKHLVERSGLAVSSSTVRSELAELETRGLLTHPHTSAGRVPTDRGYRQYVDALLDRPESQAEVVGLDLGAARKEVESALQATTEMLSRVTRLLAIASAPPLATTVVRHVEVLCLQPEVVMVVVITSAGGVSKRRYVFDGPVDPGLATWAAQYLNEQVAGLRLGSHTLRQRLEESGLAESERRFLHVLRPSFTELEREEQQLFVGGAGGLLEDVRSEDLGPYRSLLEILESRAALLDLLAQSLEPRRPFVRVGDELDIPALRDLSLVGSSYGLVNRSLGAVSLVGPLRMDYDKALRTVRGAAVELSRFVEEIYGEN
ncbi:MAG: heat-inducible transcriptional repressor HrcA [Gaiellaceae bacterium]